jgi:CHASE2 domain-containing sensor protein
VRFLKPDARTVAVAASMAAVALLVTLIVWRRHGILPVVLALLCVLLAMIAGTAVAAVRQGDDRQPAGPPAAPSLVGLHDVDADTLEALDSRAVRDRRRTSDPSDR